MRCLPPRSVTGWLERQPPCPAPLCTRQVVPHAAAPCKCRSPAPAPSAPNHRRQLLGPVLAVMALALSVGIYETLVSVSGN